MIFNLDLEKVWERNKSWDLDKRTMYRNSIQTINTTTSGRILPMLSEQNYIVKMQSTGKYIQQSVDSNGDIVSNVTQLSNVTNDTVNITATANSYGIGLPYYVKQGQQVKIKLTGGNNTIYVNIAAYDSEGFLIGKSSTNILSAKNQTSSGIYTVQQDGWIVVIMYPYNANIETVVTNISLFIQ